MPNSSPAWIRTVEVAVVVAGDVTPTTQSFDEVVDAIEAVETDVEAVNTELDTNWEEEKELWFPTNKRAAGNAGKYNGGATTYQTVATWTVATGWTGELKEILFLSDQYAHTLWQITVGAVTWCTNWNPQGSMPIIFEDLRLAAGSAVTVQAKSDDGTTIEADAIIVGKEFS